jgi:predicted nucleic acid-binding protein
VSDCVGLIDTNVFIHALTHDSQAEECLRFLDALAAGELQAQLEPLVLHELSYAVRHYRKGMSRPEIAEYLLAVLAWQGVLADKGLLVKVVERWRDHPALAFVDAYLATLAATQRCPVYTKNASELRQQGVQVPDPLPTGRVGA